MKPIVFVLMPYDMPSSQLKNYIHRAVPIRTREDLIHKMRGHSLQFYDVLGTNDDEGLVERFKYLVARNGHKEVRVLYQKCLHYKGLDVEVFYYNHPGQKGIKDSFGVPLEPSSAPSIEIESVVNFYTRAELDFEAEEIALLIEAADAMS